MIPLNPFEFAGAVWRLLAALVTGKPLFADPDVFRARMDVCSRDCPSYEAGSGQCRICSCFIGIKARLATEECPSKLWRKNLLNTRSVR